MQDIAHQPGQHASADGTLVSSFLALTVRAASRHQKTS